MSLFGGGDERFCLFPICHSDIWVLYKKHEACFWTAEEIDLSCDILDWKEKLNENERFFIKMVLAFFAASDGIVNENLALKFYNDVTAAEARSFYAFQMAMESIHSETYSLLIDTLVTDKEEQLKLFNATSTIPVINDKANWCKKFISDDDFKVRLVAFACVEGIFFSSSFCAIYWLKKRGIMPGLTFSNELIARDEGLHTEFACLLYRKMDEKLTREKIVEIFTEAVELEQNFITHALPCSLVGMNCSCMKRYIEFVADRLLESLGEKKIYFSENPFDWMEMISLQGKTNFFEKRVSEYSKSGVMDSLNGNNRCRFSLTDEF